MSSLLDPRNSHGDYTISSHYYGPNASMPPHSTTRYSAIEYGIHLGQNVEPDTLREFVEGEKNKADAARNSGMVTYSFDLSRPLSDQLKKADEYLHRVQNEVHGKVIRKPRRAQWSLYLRALDAFDAEASPTEMMKVFWPGDQKERSQAADTLKLARAVRDNFPLIL
jgi:hypothetical protein